MDVIEARAITEDGTTVPVTLIVCEGCGKTSFHVFLVEGEHQHLQCTECNVSYCDGTCGGLKLGLGKRLKS